MAKEKKYSNSESFEIYCNYGVLRAEKRNVYTYGCEHCHAVCSDKIKVYLPANDLFHTYKNNEGLLMVESEWGFCYEINEILEEFYERCIEERILEIYGVNIEIFRNDDFMESVSND